MSYTLEYHPAVLREDIPRLGTSEKEQIKKALADKLIIAPEQFGKPLRKTLKGYWKLRVGDFRVIFRFEKNIVRVFAILHRSVVYKQVRTEV